MLMKRLKVCTVVGARPQFIKTAPVGRRLREVAIEVLVHTGQHYDDDMSEVFFRELKIPQPDYNLDVGSGPHGFQTGQMLKRLEEVLNKEKADIVVVYGDTNSTLAGALAAAKLHIPVAHVEAGLRSFNRRMPEEINRVLTDHISSLLFCPTATAVNNLAREGIIQGVHLVGDVMYDAVMENLQIAESKSRALERLAVKPRSYVLATVHRAENTDDLGRLRNIVEALCEVSKIDPVVWPVHPRTRKSLDGFPLTPLHHGGLRLIDPVSYLDMLMLEKHARVILTDSGGVQKEAHWLEVACVTLREVTEWIETVEAGWNRLAGSDRDEIVRAVAEASLPSRKVLSEFGERASAAASIVNLLREFVSTI